MAAQQHKIMRQVLELHGCAPDDAPRLQSELRETYYRRLVPLIDKVCSDLGSPGRVERIETLEVDLGEVALDELEGALAGRFEAAFSRALAGAIGAGAPRGDAELEAFASFIRTGSVPWWADLSDRDLLEAGLQSLLARDPQALRRAIQAAPDQERMRRRLALAYSDASLDRLLALIAPSSAAAFPGLGTAWPRLLESASVGRGHPARSGRNFWWEELLRAAQTQAAASGAPLFLRAILARIARRLAIGYPALVADLRGTLDGGSPPAPREVRAVVEELWRQLEGEDDSGPRPDAAALAALERQLARLEAILAPHPALLARLQEARRLPAHLRARAAALLEASAFEAGVAGALPAAEALESHISKTKEKDQPAPASRFSDADELYVENAGLVILWPFLGSFFALLELLDEKKKFKDAAAMQRAAGLLQYLATGEAPAAEYLLPLNKVLCAMPLDEVFDFGPPLTDAEIEACDDLLGAVIQQAPILRSMSIAGFRASFLRRKGQLGARDGAWLLRVERETHDVVLDRFPWSRNLVKLPWMEAPMQVEW